MIEVKPLTDIVGKWKSRAPAAAVDYKRGVERTKKDWAAITAAAQDNYNSGVQAAMAAGRFAAGVARAGTAKWKTATMAKGPLRWQQGIELGGDNYSRGFAPYLTILEGLSLTARGPRGSTQNYERSRQVGEALHAARIGGAA